MKKTLHAILLLTVFLPVANVMAQHKLTKLWETDTLLKVPESVRYDADNKVLYTANIDGNPWDADGKGSIGKVSLDGKIIQTDWVTGLNCPKGMGLYKGKLYVADLANVIVIDIKKGSIEKTIAVEGAGGLNDISIGSDGVIWVSDSKNKRIYKIENEKPVLYLENLKGPNGVLMRGKDFYILDNGGLYKVNDDKTLALITDGMEGGTDGLENITGNDFIVSCWAGAIWYVNDKNEKQLLLDTREQKKNTADIGLNAKEKIIYVPTFFKNSVVAYKVE